MPSESYRIYWDSDVIISYLGEEQDRVKTLEEILSDVAASDGKKKIITSEVSKVEVAYITTEKASRSLLDDTEKKIDDFWRDDSVIELVEFGDHVAPIARSFMRECLANGWRVLKPMDSIHLATAKWAQVKEFHTYNTADFLKYQGFLPFKVLEPFIREPGLFSSLP